MQNNIDLLKIDEIITKFFEDKTVMITLIIFFIGYISLVSPKLQKNCSVFKLMDSNLFQFAILLLIGYISSKNFSVGLLLLASFFATLFTMQKHQVNDRIVSILLVNAVDNSQPIIEEKKQKHVQFVLPENESKSQSLAEISIMKEDEPVAKPVIFQEIGRIGTSVREAKKELNVRGPMAPLVPSVLENETKEHFEISGMDSDRYALF